MANTALASIRTDNLHRDVVMTFPSSNHEGNSHSSSSAATAADLEGYQHGTLTTAGITGAAPAVRSLTKQVAATLAAKGLSSSVVAAAAATASKAGITMVPHMAPGSAPHADEPGMKPRTRHPLTTSRPDLTHTTRDIDGASPSLESGMWKHPRNTSPLDPKYILAVGAPNLPLGPEVPDKHLRDSLSVADIPGASPGKRQPMSASTAVSRSKGGPLNVDDIEGTTIAWNPYHRRHIGLNLRDAGLNVSDINSYMARFKPGPRAPVYKGHPGGPKITPRVHPRQNPAEVDNSLRNTDIEGTRLVLRENRPHARKPHDHTTSVADIQGTAPADRDWAHLFKRKKAAAEASVAASQAGQAVLSGLQLDQSQLAALWGQCSRMDKDGSGLLTAPELEQALQSAKLQLPAADTQHLLSALKDNAGLVNYKKFTRRLKGKASLPNPAQQQSPVPQQPQQQRQVVLSSQQQPDTAQKQQSDSKQQQQQQQWQPGVVPGSTIAMQLHSTGFHFLKRPSTAPAGTGKAHTAASSLGTSSGYNSINLWFSGSRKDTGAVAESTAWRPGRDLEHGWAPGRSLFDPATSTLTGDKSGEIEYTAAQEGGAGSGDVCSSSIRLQGVNVAAVQRQAGHEPFVGGADSRGFQRDLLPGWVIGHDPLRGTHKVAQPFGAAADAAMAQEAQQGGQQTQGTAAPAAAAAAAAPPGRNSMVGSISSFDGMRAAAALKRPASAGPCLNSRTSGAGWVSSPGVSSTTGKALQRSSSPGGVLAWTQGTTGMPGGRDIMAAAVQQQQQQRSYSPSPHKQRPKSASLARRSQSPEFTGAAGGYGSGGQQQQWQGAAATRPLSAGRAGLGGIGFSEKRRFMESLQEELASVRLLQ